MKNKTEKFRIKEKWIIDDLYADEREVECQYFTKERLAKLKDELLEQIKETEPEDLFKIYCIDTDIGWNYTKDELFDLK